MVSVVPSGPVAWASWSVRSYAYVVTWPDVSPSAATPAAAETELDFFLDSDGEGDGQLLAVVMPS